MRILAIDPGTKCGWALDDNGVVVSGVWNLAQRRYQGGGMRFVLLAQNLRDIGKVDRVYFEEVRRHMGVDAAHIYGGIVAVITGRCERQGTPYCGIPVGTIKKLATGKGNAGKDEMVEAARRLYPDQNVIDDNQADALCILHASKSVENNGRA